MKANYRGFKIEAVRDWNMLHTEKFIFSSCFRVRDGLVLSEDHYLFEMSVRSVIEDQKIEIDQRLKNSGCQNGDEEAEKEIDLSKLPSKGY
jgi:hypothetical protein